MSDTLTFRIEIKHGKEKPTVITFNSATWQLEVSGTGRLYPSDLVLLSAWTDAIKAAGSFPAHPVKIEP